MARTATQRFDQALAHIRMLSDELADDIVRKGLNKTSVGDELSLEGAGYWKSGTDEQHMAVRGLLLCLIAYFRPPHSKFPFATSAVLTDTKTAMKGRSVTAVNEEIMLYLPRPGVKLEDLAAVTDRVNKVEGAVDALKRTRADANVSYNPVCYHGVSTWLFASGFVSKRWFAKEGSELTGYTANRYIGDGTEVPQRNWGSILRGYIFNIHKKNDQSTCHWGVSLGSGRAVGCNNTDGSPGQNLNYEGAGTSQCGKFNFVELCTLLNQNRKYKIGKSVGEVGDVPKYIEEDHPSGVNIVVRAINPEAMGAIYY